MAEKIYIIENLGCANCAAKMEEKIRRLPQVEDASITFATRQLRLKHNVTLSLRGALAALHRPQADNIYTAKQHYLTKRTPGVLSNDGTPGSIFR